jgi:hypothetical protein
VLGDRPEPAPMFLEIAQVSGMIRKQPSRHGPR